MEGKIHYGYKLRLCDGKVGKVTSDENEVTCEKCIRKFKKLKAVYA